MEQKTEEKTIWDKIGTIDYRYIYVFSLIMILIPIIQPIGIPMKVGSNAQTWHNTIVNIPAHSYILFNYYVDLSVWADMGPILVVTLNEVWMIPKERDVKVFFYSSTADGAVKIKDLFATVCKPPQWRTDSYGTTWVDVGYIGFPNEAAYASFVMDFKSLILTDIRGTRLLDVPAAKEMAAHAAPTDVLTAADFDLLIWSSWGCTDPDMYVRQFWASGSPPYHVPMLMQTIGNCVPNVVPYVGPDKPIRAFIPGAAGAAELEMITGLKGDGTKMADATDLGGVTTVLLVVLGNIAYLGGRFLGKKKEEK
jgi:hypothetical protein